MALVLALPMAVAAQEKAAEKVALVVINTTAGRMVVELYNETPVHRDNFLKLVREGFYDSTLFHKAIPGFMVQGGDPDSRTAGRGTPLGSGGPGYTLPAEIEPGLYHRKGALAAVREPDQDNPERRSNGSQFYLVQGRKWYADDLAKLEEQRNQGRPDSLRIHYAPEDLRTYELEGGSPHLDGNYTVFGQVLEGMDVLDRIAGLLCDGYDRPLTDVRMWMRVME
ncbi:MAG: peptidylprolyl isomerase [Flavobacteriales bacterium]